MGTYIQKTARQYRRQSIIASIFPVLFRQKFTSGRHPGLKAKLGQEASLLAAPCPIESCLNISHLSNTPAW